MVWTHASATRVFNFRVETLPPLKANPKPRKASEESEACSTRAGEANENRTIKTGNGSSRSGELPLSYAQSVRNWKKNHAKPGVAVAWLRVTFTHIVRVKTTPLFCSNMISNNWKKPRTVIHLQVSTTTKERAKDRRIVINIVRQIGQDKR